MTKNYLPPEKRKKILFLADDIRTTSGIAGIAREIVIGTSHVYNFCVIGGSMKHPDAGKQLDLSADTNQHAGITDSYVKLYPTDGYGNPELVRSLIKLEKPDAIMFFTDPRYWVWLFQMENELRVKLPFIYLNIWDDLPCPYYNAPYYESCDTLMAISKQTLNINKLVLGEKAKDKILEFVPHGINEKFYFPIDKSFDKYKEFLEFKKQLLKEKEYDFILMYNSRNIRRKATSDIMIAYKLFCDKIGEEKASKCALILHTQPIDDNGTDLLAVRDLLAEDYMNIIFSDQRLGIEQMNYLYNMSDATILISSNEGWGLSLTEGLICGKMIIGNVTGGMQDQMRFEDEDGKWIDFDENFCSNHFGTYKKCGEWVMPVFPNNISLIGSVPTPYIFDDRCDFRDVAKVIEQVYNLSPEERNRRGMKGREWALGDEAQFTAVKMCDKIINVIDKTFDTWKPRKHFELIKIDKEYPKKKLKHKLIY